ncbi:hypothetical protein [Coleofasciculus sp. FACHB-SPT9]|uniref:hypothetical protein n=1 Tax=Cyanophyceae TaxID=3028117 RepID=UPI0016859323|nr:hypothetical protein [Coleofasciculus sp. FACHB-SPT9]
MKTMRPKFIFLTAFLLASFWFASRFTQSSIVRSAPQAQVEPTKAGSSLVQFVFQPNTPEIVSTTEDILYYTSEKVRSHQLVEVSFISDSGINVVFSKRPTRRAIQELRNVIDGDQSTSKIDPISSNETQLIASVQRFRDRVLTSNGEQPIHFYIVTNGTSDPQIIERVREICSSLSKQNLQNAHLYLLGLSSNNRLPISQGFTPISDHVEFASADYNEWIQLLRKF